MWVTPVVARCAWTDWIAASVWKRPKTRDLAARARQRSASAIKGCGPEGDILFGEGDEGAVRGAACAAAGGGVQHQGQETPGFGLIGEEVCQEAAQEDRFLGEAGFQACGESVVPSGAVGGVDGREDGGQAPGQGRGLWRLEADSGVADFRLGADEALGHRGGRGQEGRGDAGGVQAQDGLEHEGGLRGRVDGLVGADEEELEAGVGKVVVLAVCGFGVDQFQGGGGGLAHGAVAGDVSEGPSCDRQQPGFGVAGHAVGWPGLQRAAEGFREGVLGGRDVSGAGGDQGEQAAVGGARHVFGDVARVCHQAAGGGRTGRTSTLPSLAEGERAAHSRASSRPGASMTT